MSSDFLRFSALALFLSLLAGCGGLPSSGSGSTGGNSGGGGSPTTVTFTFDSAGSTPAVVATRIGTGVFNKTTLSSNVLTLSIPAGMTSFAVAYLCPTYPYFSGGVTYSNNDQYVVQASTETVHRT